MEVWISKHAISKGVYKVEAEMTTYGSVIFTGENHFFIYVSKGGWHKTEHEANLKAEESRLKRIAGLKAQISKLEKLSFK